MWLPKNLRPRELLDALRAVYRGSALLPGQSLLRDAIEEAAPDGGEDEEDAESLFASLSRRERDVAALMLRSFGNKLIAERLCLSEQTVRNYISSIYFKLDVKDRFEFYRILGRLAPSGEIDG